MFHVLYGVHLKSLQESMVLKTCKNFPKLNGPTLNSVAITVKNVQIQALELLSHGPLERNLHFESDMIAKLKSNSL